MRGGAEPNFARYFSLKVWKPAGSGPGNQPPAAGSRRHTAGSFHWPEPTSCTVSRETPGRLERRQDRRQRLRALRHEHRVGLPRRAAGHRRDLGDRLLEALRVAVAGDVDDPAAGPRRRLAQRPVDDVAIGARRQDRREVPLALPGGVGDHPLDVGLGQEAQEIDAGGGDVRIGGEADHRHVRLPRHLARPLHRGGGQRADDEPGVLLHRALRGGRGALRRAGGVERQDLDLRVRHLGHGELGGVHQRLARAGVVAAEGQQQRDLHLARAERRRGRLLRARVRAQRKALPARGERQDPETRGQAAKSAADPRKTACCPIRHRDTPP